MSRLALLGGILLGLSGVGTAQSGGDGQAPAGMGRGQMVRGTVSATAADHLTVKTETGETYIVSINANTRVLKGRDPMKLADVHAGDGVGAMGEIDAPNKTVHALFVSVVDAEQLKKAREAMGKTYIAGRVTAMDDVKLTIMRSDGVSQVITVDEDTSFKKGGRGMQMMMGGSAAPAAGGGGAGGESITLADVKVGDTVAGPGTLKSGIFVPTQLMVGEPGANGGQGRRRRQGDAPATAAPGAAAPTSPGSPNEMELK